MISLLIFIIIGLCISIYTIINEWELESISSRIWMCIWRPILSVFLSVVFGCLFLIFIGKFFDKKDVLEKDRTIKICSINDRFDSSGQFFLGCGSFENKPYYFFYKKENGGIKLDKISTENAIIIQQDSVTPRIEIYAKEFVDKKNINWGIPSGDKTYKIYVPKNSVKEDFNFDLK